MKVRVEDVDALERTLGVLRRIPSVARTRTTVVLSTRFEGRRRLAGPPAGHGEAGRAGPSRALRTTGRQMVLPGDGARARAQRHPGGSPGRRRVRPHLPPWSPRARHPVRPRRLRRRRPARRRRRSGARAAAERRRRPRRGHRDLCGHPAERPAAGHDLAVGGVQLRQRHRRRQPARPRRRHAAARRRHPARPRRPSRAGSRRTVDGVSSSAPRAGPRGIAELTGPALEVGADVVDGRPSTTAGASSLGAPRVLGLPVSVGGVLRRGSPSTRRRRESAKTLEVTGVALPSVADLLAALGLDLSKLPVARPAASSSTELDLAHARRHRGEQGARRGAGRPQAADRRRGRRRSTRSSPPSPPRRRTSPPTAAPPP